MLHSINKVFLLTFYLQIYDFCLKHESKRSISKAESFIRWKFPHLAQKPKKSWHSHFSQTSWIDGTCIAERTSHLKTCNTIILLRFWLFAGLCNVSCVVCFAYTKCTEKAGRLLLSWQSLPSFNIQDFVKWQINLCKFNKQATVAITLILWLLSLILFRTVEGYQSIRILDLSLIAEIMMVTVKNLRHITYHICDCYQGLKLTKMSGHKFATSYKNLVTKF